MNGYELLDKLLENTLYRLTLTIHRLLKPRALYTFLFFGLTVILIYEEKKVPELLKTVDIALLAFYFGEKSARYLKNGNVIPKK